MNISIRNCYLKKFFLNFIFKLVPKNWYSWGIASYNLHSSGAFDLLGMRMGNKFTYKLPVPINLLRCILRLMPQYNLSLGVLLFIFSLCYQVILCFIMYMLQINGCSLILYARCYRYNRLLYNFCASDRNNCNLYYILRTSSFEKS